MLLGLASCQLYQKSVADQNLAFLYQFGDDQGYLEHKVFHFSPDSSRVYIKANISNWKEQLKSLPNGYKLTLRVYQYSSFGSRKITDTLLYENEEKNYNSTSQFEFPVGIDSTGWQLLKLQLTCNRSTGYIDGMLDIDRRAFFGEQFYSFETQVDGKLNIKANRFFSSSEPFVVKSLFGELVDDYSITKMTSNAKLPLPVFYKARTKAARLQNGDIASFRSGDSLSLEEHGIYLLKNDLDTLHGILLYNFYKGFPSIKEVNHLIEPLRYITQQSEHDILSNSREPKASLDSFWLEIAGSKERASRLIREYYNRVRYANQYFTELVPGWQTDRGMVFMVYGQPDLIFKDGAKESWIYSNWDQEENVEFWFIKAEHNYTENYFVLDRIPQYESSWYKAVSMWREGKIINPSFK